MAFETLEICYKRVAVKSVIMCKGMFHCFSSVCHRYRETWNVTSKL